MEIPSLRVVHDRQSIRIYRGDGQEPILVQCAPADQRPYIHPVVAPDGRGIMTENSPSHHPWQHGIYVGLNDINGIGFWKEGLRNDPLDGTFHPKPLQTATADGHQVRWEVETEWRDPAGINMLTELQQWHLYDQGATFELDLKWSLLAHLDLKFGQSAYGGLFLRMPYRQERGGEVVNSEGQMNTDAEGKRARWAACSMQIDDRDEEAGIAIMDHPGNPEHPVPWRVDKQLGISPSRCIAGPWRLNKGQVQSCRYRIEVFCGKTDQRAIDHNWSKFATLNDAMSR